MRTFFVLFYLIFTCLLVYGQTGMPVLTQDDYPGLLIKSNNNYSDSSLWGYLDGGADIYFEYGFTALQVMKFIAGNENFKLECYKMKDAKAAFGIYSVSHNKCPDSGKELKFNCENKYQLQFAKAEYYISLINESGTAKAMVVAAFLAREIADKIHEKEYSLPDYFNGLLIPSGLNRFKLITGKLGLKNGYPDWEGLFDHAGKFSLYILDLPESRDTLLNVLIYIDKPAELSDLYKSLGFDFRRNQDNYYYEKDGMHFYLSICSCGEVKIWETRM